MRQTELRKFRTYIPVSRLFDPSHRIFGEDIQINPSFLGRRYIPIPLKFYTIHPMFGKERQTRCFIDVQPESMGRKGVYRGDRHFDLVGQSLRIQHFGWIYDPFLPIEVDQSSQKREKPGEEARETIIYLPPRGALSFPPLSSWSRPPLINETTSDWEKSYLPSHPIQPSQRTKQSIQANYLTCPAKPSNQAI